MIPQLPHESSFNDWSGTHYSRMELLMDESQEIMAVSSISCTVQHSENDIEDRGVIDMSGFICPFPLVSYNISDLPAYSTVYDAYAGSCAVPCPSIDFKPSEWITTVNITLILSAISTLASFVVLIAHLTEFRRFFIRVMFIGGFFSNSLIITIFLFSNRSNKITCAGGSEDTGYPFFVEKGAFCVFQAAASIWFFLWTQTWSAILAYDTYLHVFLFHREFNMKMLRQRYTAVALGLPSAITAIPLALGTF